MNRGEATEALGDWQDKLLLLTQENRRGYVPAEGVRGKFRARMRTRIMAAILIVVGLGLVMRLGYLSVIESGKHRMMSENNSLMQVKQFAPRGIIYDRNGRPVVANRTDEEGRGREYLLEKQGAHLFGYLSEATEGELGCREGICYRPGDWVGRSGIEKVFESRLRGQDGGKIVEIDALGEEVRNLGSNMAEPGQDVTLSVDMDLQRIAAEAMGEREGSVVVLSMQGKVLALYSSPSYDPNVFTLYPNEAEKKTLLSDKEKQYFLNRAIGGEYAPGSVFKLVTAYAGLETGKIGRDTLIEDTGEIRIDQYRYGNWFFDQYGLKEGRINLEKALARSNDIFFYKAGELVGVDELVKWSKKFGLGESTGIELGGEVEGLVPSKLWKERITGERWFLGNTYHLSIGQGDLTATPIQITRMTLAAVTGHKCELSVLKDSPVKCESLGLKTENMEIVRSGMRQVCAIGGTAFPFFDFAPYVLCKTGTAQHGGQKTDEDLPHAWIVVAYPGENPEMVLTVMLPSAGEGSYEAGPVAKEIVEKWRDLGH